MKRARTDAKEPLLAWQNSALAAGWTPPPASPRGPQAKARGLRAPTVEIADELVEAAITRGTPPEPAALAGCSRAIFEAYVQRTRDARYEAGDPTKPPEHADLGVMKRARLDIGDELGGYLEVEVGPDAGSIAVRSGYGRIAVFPNTANVATVVAFNSSGERPATRGGRGPGDRELTILAAALPGSRASKRGSKDPAVGGPGALGAARPRRGGARR